MNQTINYLDSLDWIERYAWFGFFVSLAILLVFNVLTLILLSPSDLRTMSMSITVNHLSYVIHLS